MAARTPHVGTVVVAAMLTALLTVAWQRSNAVVDAAPAPGELARLQHQRQQNQERQQPVEAQRITIEYHVNPPPPATRSPPQPPVNIHKGADKNPNIRSAVCKGICLNFACRTEIRGKTMVQREIVVRGVLSENVWGSTVYSSDSIVGAAAVHAGLVKPGELRAVRVQCVDTREGHTFTGSERHGIVSKSVPPADGYPAGFTLKAMTKDDFKIEKCTSHRCLHNRCFVMGERFHLNITNYTVPGPKIFGTDIYSDDSSVRTAAVHAGLVTKEFVPGPHNLVTAHCLGKQLEFPGSTRNGITTSIFSVWYGSFTMGPMEDATSVTGPVTQPDFPPYVADSVCTGPCVYLACSDLVLKPGKDILREVLVRAPDSAKGDLFGGNNATSPASGMYSASSDVGLAAVHAGLLDFGEHALLAIHCFARAKDDAVKLAGSTGGHNVSSKAMEVPATNFFRLRHFRPSDVQIREPCFMPVSGESSCIHNNCIVTGERRHVLVRGSTIGNVIGTGFYTDDTDVGPAAVHQGLLEVGENGYLTAYCLGAHKAYVGSISNDIKSRSFGPWHFSYTLAPRSWSDSALITTRKK